MESNRSNGKVNIEEKKTKIVKKSFSDGCEKIILPYLDWRINPEHLNFNEEDPASSTLNSKYIDTKFKIPQIAIYNKSRIGAGMFGYVLIAQDTTTKEWLAIKIPQDATSISDETIEKIKEEIEQLKISGDFIFYDECVHAIGMKLLQGYELFSAIVKNESKNKKIFRQSFSLLQRIVIAKDILKKTAAIHKDIKYLQDLHKIKQQVVHRDIKTKNIIVNTDLHTVQYCDYGMAMLLKINTNQKEIEQLSSKPKTEGPNPTKGQFEDSLTRGTPVFIAPELLTNKKKIYGETTEVFAAGMVLAEIFEIAKESKKTILTTGKSGLNYSMQRYEIIDREDVPKNIINFIRRMVDDQFENRCTVLEAAIFFNKQMQIESMRSALKTVVISIDEFLAFDKEEKQTFINSIIKNKINVICFQASHKTSNKNYYQARYQLTILGIINIANFMISGMHSTNTLRIVKDHYDHAFSAINTKVFVYANMKMVDKTPVNIIPKYAKKNYWSNDSKNSIMPEGQDDQWGSFFIASIKEKIRISLTLLNSKDEMILKKLININIKNGKDFLPFIRSIEAAYIDSLKNCKSLLGELPTIDEINNQPEKYNLCRVLGILLQSIYKILDGIDTGNFSKKIPDVDKIKPIVSKEKHYEKLRLDDEIVKNYRCSKKMEY